MDSAIAQKKRLNLTLRVRDPHLIVGREDRVDRSQLGGQPVGHSTTKGSNDVLR